MTKEERRAQSLETASGRLRERTGDPEFAFFVPGRIEVLGKHTDYAGGRSLLAALEWGFTFVGCRGPRRGELLVLDAAGGRELRIPLAPSAWTVPRGWGRYPATVARRVVRDFPEVGEPSKSAKGVTLAFASDLPQAAGMSSSSALVVGTFLALAAGLQLEGHSPFGGFLDPELTGGFAGRERLAAYLAAVEAGRPLAGPGVPRGADTPEGGGITLKGEGIPGVGTDGGSEDHTAILSARPDHLVRYRFLPTRYEGAAPLPPGWVFAVASSGVRAEKAEGARGTYNRLAEEARTAARVWREATGGNEPHLGAILAGSEDARARMEEILRGGEHPRLLDRFRQFTTECLELIPGAASALTRGDLEAFGEHAARSQALAEEVLGNQVPETRHLAAAARELGAPAASAFGAGFGGAVWALVSTGEVEDFLAAWRGDYLRRFPARGEACAFLGSGAGPPASRLF